MSDDARRAIAELRLRIAELEAQLSERGTPPAADIPPPRPLRALIAMRLLHRWAAVIAFVFLFVMGVTGIFLSHADQLGMQPLMIQLHAGLFLGPLAWLYCDLLGVAAITLSVTGIYMHLVPHRKPRPRSGE